MKNETRLTFDGRLKFSPTVHPSGDRLIFCELETPELLRLKELTLSTGEIRQLHPDAKTSELEPRFSQVGDVYLFLQTKGVLTLGVVVKDEPGSRTPLGEIPPPSGLAGYRGPVFPTHHRNHVVYSLAEAGRQQIFQSRFDGSDRKLLIDSPGINNWPDFTSLPDRMVFASSRDGNFEIYCADPDGQNQRRLTESPRQDIRPRFSPMGDRIAFTSHRGGHAEIYLMNSYGGNLRRVTNHPDRSDFATWHPDGEQIIFVGERDGRTDLYMLNVA